MHDVLLTFSFQMNSLFSGRFVCLLGCGFCAVAIIFAGSICVRNVHDNNKLMMMMIISECRSMTETHVVVYLAIGIINKRPCRRSDTSDTWQQKRKLRVVWPWSNRLFGVAVLLFCFRFVVKLFDNLLLIRRHNGETAYGRAQNINIMRHETHTYNFDNHTAIVSKSIELKIFT